MNYDSTETDRCKWPMVPLRTIGVVICGQSPPSKAVNTTGKGVPYVSGPEHWDGSTVQLNKWTTEPKRMAPEGCVFVTVKGARVGTVFPGVEAAIGRDIYAFKPSDDIDPRYVEHALRHTTVRVVRSARGDIPGLSKDHLLNHDIVLPPLSEQRRIVAQIEKHCTRLDAGMAALKRVQANLKRYRTALLKAACEGRLVPTDADLARQAQRRGDFETGGTLLARIFEKRRRSNQRKRKCHEPVGPNLSNLPCLPDGWCWATLDQVAEVVGGITVDQKRRHSAPSRPVPYLRVANVQRGYLDLRQVKQIIATENEIGELALRTGDILFTEGGDRDKLGRGWVWSDELPECVHQNHVFRARLHGTELSPKLVSWYANTAGQKFFFDEGKHTTNLASISMSKLRHLPIPVPPPSEQARIVAEVERKLSMIEGTEATIDANLQRAAALRQSIFERAFSGELNPVTMISAYDLVSQGAK